MGVPFPHSRSGTESRGTFSSQIGLAARHGVEGARHAFRAHSSALSPVIRIIGNSRLISLAGHLPSQIDVGHKGAYKHARRCAFRRRLCEVFHIVALLPEYNLSNSFS